MLWVSLFVFVGLLDGGLRFLWLERDRWTCNSGVFWGIEFPQVFLWIGTGGVVLGCLWLLFRWKGLGMRWPLIAILIGGGINTLDRALHTCVLDYFHWPFGLASFFPNFNLSDTMIFVGVLTLLFSSAVRKQTENWYVVDTEEKVL